MNYSVIGGVFQYRLTQHGWPHVGKENSIVVGVGPSYIYILVLTILNAVSKVLSVVVKNQILKFV